MLTRRQSLARAATGLWSDNPVLATQMRRTGYVAAAVQSHLRGETLPPNEKLNHDTPRSYRGE